MAIVNTTNHIEDPNVIDATPAAIISLRNGPNTYKGDVAGSPPPASAPSSELDNLCVMLAIVLAFYYMKAASTDKKSGFYSNLLRFDDKPRYYYPFKLFFSQDNINHRTYAVGKRVGGIARSHTPQFRLDECYPNRLLDILLH